jgi:Skp family chaperone for outer membrane proteins
MHSAHRDLESKYKRVFTDLQNEKKQVEMLRTKLTESKQEITLLKTTKAEHESLIAQNEEEI